MPTDPLTGTSYPASNFAPNIAQFFQDVVFGLSDNTIPRFATTTARDTAYTAWVAAGNTMADGLHCWVNGVGLQAYVSGAWGPAAARGLVVAGRTATNQSSSTATEARVVGETNLTGTLYPGRAYRVRWSSAAQSDAAGDVVTVAVRGARNATPTSTSTRVASASRPITSAGGPGSGVLEFSDVFTVASVDSYTISAFLSRATGTGTVTVVAPHAELEDAGVASVLAGAYAQLT